MRPRARPIKRVALVDYVEWGAGGQAWLIALARAEVARGEAQTYFLPLALAWEDATRSACARCGR